MRDLFSFEEILYFMLHKEEHDASMYQDIAKIATTPKLKRKLKKMSAENSATQKSHQKNLQKLLGQTGQTNSHWQEDTYHDYLSQLIHNKKIDLKDITSSSALNLEQKISHVVTTNAANTLSLYTDLKQYAKNLTAAQQKLLHKAMKTKNRQHQNLLKSIDKKT